MMSVEHWWNGTDRGKTEVPKQKAPIITLFIINFIGLS